MAHLSPIHPGEILSAEFLVPFGLTQYRLAVDLRVPPRRINEIVLGRRGISADTALRLAHYFGNTPEFWMNLQTRFDLEVERARMGNLLDKSPRHDSALRQGRKSGSDVLMLKRKQRRTGHA